jgi:sugar phosphate permease
MSQTSGNSTRFTAEAASATSSHSLARSLENQVVWTLWLTYGAFYFCRTNLSVANASKPGMTSAVADGGLGLSDLQVGWILASLKIAYGLGQLVNGQVSERVSPRVMLAIGMFGSAALNVAFGMGTGFYFLLFVWATNGFCQSLGWTPCMRVVANWIPIARRGKAIGIIGTGYQITFGLTYVIAGYATNEFGWRGAFYVPAALLALAGLFMLVFLRESPTELNEHGDNRMGAGPAQQPRLPFSELLYWTLYNPALWLIGATLFLVNACRYGYLDWGVKHLVETRSLAIDKAVLQYFVIAIGAAAGSYLAGWATDRFFGSRRAPVICILLVALGAFSVVYEPAVRSGPLPTMAVLIVIGFCIIGPQVLLVGTAPADMAHRGASAAAAGFVNFMGYVGAATGDVVTGYVTSAESGGWKLAIYIWAGWAFAGAAIMAMLWNTTTDKIGLLPSIAPKLAAMAALAAAAAGNAFGGQPAALQAATIAAAICLLATFKNCWAALLPLGVATAGLLIVFMSYAERGGDLMWQEGIAMAGYALTMLCALMILVDRGAERCELL